MEKATKVEKAIRAEKAEKVAGTANGRMTPFEKRHTGTVPQHIGARFVLRGGFGCVPPWVELQLVCSPPLRAVRVWPPASLVDVRAPPACSVWAHE